MSVPNRSCRLIYDDGLQDLSGFDDNIKAVHGTPSKKSVSFGHSLSMPLIRTPGTGQTPSRRALSRTTTSAATPGEGFLSRRSHPSVLTDSSTTPFGGFPTMPALEVGLLSLHPFFRMQFLAMGQKCVALAIPAKFVLSCPCII